jgi:hypothetical protein
MQFLLPKLVLISPAGEVCSSSARLLSRQIEHVLGNDFAARGNIQELSRTVPADKQKSSLWCL